MVRIIRKYHKEIDELKAVNPGINDLKIGQIINIPIENTVNDKSETSLILLLI